MCRHSLCPPGADLFDLAALHVKRTPSRGHLSGPGPQTTYLLFANSGTVLGSYRLDQCGGTPCRFHGNGGSRGRVALCPLRAGSLSRRSLTGAIGSGMTTYSFASRSWRRMLCSMESRPGVSFL